MTDFFNKVKQHFKQNLPFVIYKKPNTQLIKGLFQNDSKLNLSDNLSETGFVFTSFDGNKKTILSKNNSEEITTDFIPELFGVNPKKTTRFDTTVKNNFESLVSKAINEIQMGTFSKVVVSRKEIVELPDFDIASLFVKLSSNYLSAFVYCWFHPEIGLWMGATPETLLKVKE
jgi:isochorismate synthase